MEPFHGTNEEWKGGEDDLSDMEDDHVRHGG